MIFLPDTNVWIRFLNPGENHAKNHFLSADPSTICLCSVVKAELFFGALKSTPIGPNDLMIAAIASVHEAVLVTHNTREFERVTGLKVEDWE